MFPRTKNHFIAVMTVIGIPTENRKINYGVVCLTGLLSGAVVHFLAESLISFEAVKDDYDTALLIRRTLLYLPIVGFWLGGMHRSWERAARGVLAGIVVGLAYAALCLTDNSFAVLAGFPCVLGGAFATLIGFNRYLKPSELGILFGKGLLAGFVLGFVDVILQAFFSLRYLGFPGESGRRVHIFVIHRYGPIAFGISSALFFLLIPWAVRLTRSQIAVHENIAAPETINPPE